MAKRMLIDATHPEETRVVVVSGNRLEEFDFETSTKKQLKGNIYLAKVTRVEPSLQAAFVDFGGNRHGFLAFNEIHPDYYRIPVADREALIAAHRAEHEISGESPEHGEASDALPTSIIEARRFEPPEDIAIAEAPGEGSDAPMEEPPLGPDARGAAADEPSHNATDGDTERSELSSQPEELVAPSSVASQPALGDIRGAEAAAYGELGGGEAASASEAPSNVETLVVPGATAQPVVESVGGEDIDDLETRRRFRPSRHYKIQEVIKRRQVLLVQVVKEERGTKGAALTTYLSLAGRYCVLMPNTDRGGGISRRITSAADRKRLKSVMDELQVPDGMAVILRTAGMERSMPEIKRDFEYLMRLWEEIREHTLKSTAPALIYEEGNLIKRAIRDLYTRDIDEILVEGEEGHKAAKTFMKTLMPSHVGRVQLYNDSVPLFQRVPVESEIDAIHQPTVRLKSGGYIVIGQTEALVAIDVNSGRSTRERHIEETALKTNLEAADEIARQLRLRDLAGLIVIDFIDMEDTRHQHQVERRLKEGMKSDRARIQIGRISPFGLLELSRQRLRPSLAEVSTERCPHCGGAGYIRSTESTALHVLRGIEEEGMKLRFAEVAVYVPTAVAMYLLNQKRKTLAGIEARYGLSVAVERDDSLVPPAYRLDRLRARTGEMAAAQVPAPIRQVDEIASHEVAATAGETAPDEPMIEASLAEEPRPAERFETPEHAADHPGGRRGRRRRRRGRGHGEEHGPRAGEPATGSEPHVDQVQHHPESMGGTRESEGGAGESEGAARESEGGASDREPVTYGQTSQAAGGEAAQNVPGDQRQGRRRRRRGRRGGRNRHGGEGSIEPGRSQQGAAESDGAAEVNEPRYPLGRVEGPGDAHDWPWNRQFDSPPEAPAAGSTFGDRPPESGETTPQAERPAPHSAAPATSRVGVNDSADRPAPASVGSASVHAGPPASRPEAMRESEAAPRQSPAKHPATAPAPEIAESPTAPARGGWWRRLTK